MSKTKGSFHIIAHVPYLILKIKLKEMSIEILKSATVSNRKIEATEYQFIFPTKPAGVTGGTMHPMFRFQQHK